MQLSSFYTGWRVLGGAFVSSALAIGFSVYIVGMFTVPVTEELGILRATYNNAVIGLMLGSALVSPVVGRLLDRYSARFIMGVAGLSFGFSLMLVSQADSIWFMMFLLTGPLAFALAACGVLGANTIVVRWFQRRRGRAMGILALSTSIGGFLSQPITAWLISIFGWRSALFLIGLASMLVFLLLAIFVIRNQPSKDIQGYREEFPQLAIGTIKDFPLDIKWTHSKLLKSRNFWLVGLCVGLFFGVDQAVLVSQVPFFQSVGYDLQITALLVSVKTISAIGGKLIVGYFADKIDLRLLFMCVAFCNVLLMIVYIVQPDYWILLSCVALLGVAVGGIFPVWTTITAWLFGASNYGLVMGLMAVITHLFAVIFIRFIGEVYDRTGSYTPAFATFILLVIAAIILIIMVRPPKKLQDF